MLLPMTRPCAVFVWLGAAAVIGAAIGSQRALRSSEGEQSHMAGRSSAECMFLLDANGVPGFAWSDTGEPCGEHPHGPFPDGVDSTPAGRGIR
jgi:hypothetical protein